eukprot:TRINITY_DN2528_c0_g3_i1.p1 TRINITY_DN2528_c0_g3~~TRINITY_DN2528_c0_g3_i1.p1  ORF type:complete len:619 (-),score=51.02 TRINITY_DN2528_c0_g3_i1:40-1896(-)
MSQVGLASQANYGHCISNHFPDELFGEIVPYLTLRELFLLMTTCKRLTPELLYRHLTHLETLFMDLEQTESQQRNQGTFLTAFSAGINSLHQYRACLTNVVSFFLNVLTFLEFRSGNFSDDLQRRMAEIIRFCAPKLKHVFTFSCFENEELAREVHECNPNQLESFGVANRAALLFLKKDTPNLKTVLVSGFGNAEDDWMEIAARPRPQLREVTIEPHGAYLNWRRVVLWIRRMTTCSPLLCKVNFRHIKDQVGNIWAAILGQPLHPELFASAPELCFNTTKLPISAFSVGEDHFWGFIHRDPVWALSPLLSQERSKILWDACNMDLSWWEAIRCLHTAENTTTPHPVLLFEKLQVLVQPGQVAPYQVLGVLHAIGCAYAVFKRENNVEALGRATAFALSLMQSTSPAIWLTDICSSAVIPKKGVLQCNHSLFQTASFLSDLCDTCSLSPLPVSCILDEIEFCSNLAKQPQLIWWFLRHPHCDLEMQSAISGESLLERIIGIIYAKLDKRYQIHPEIDPWPTKEHWPRLKPVGAPAEPYSLSNIVLLVRAIVADRFPSEGIKDELERKLLRLGLTAWLLAAGESGTMIGRAYFDKLLERFKHMLLDFQPRIDGRSFLA